MNSFINKFYTKLFLALAVIFPLSQLEGTLLADEQEKNKVQYYFTEMKKTPNKIVKVVSVDSIKNCYIKGFIASNVFDILTDGDKTNYEAIGFGICGDKLYCVMEDSTGKRFYGYRELTNKGKEELLKTLECASGD